MNIFDDIKELHEAFGHPVETVPAMRQKYRMLRKDLIEEEAGETTKAIRLNDIIEFLDGGVDLLVVLVGTCHTFGITKECFADAWDEVHRSNMAKLGPDGKPILRGDGKFLKPEGWTPPNIAGVLLKHGWEPECECEDGQKATCYVKNWDDKGRVWFEFYCDECDDGSSHPLSDLIDDLQAEAKALEGES